MFADANTSAVSPASSRSFRSPEAPNVKRTDVPARATSNLRPASTRAARRLPAANTEATSSVCAVASAANASVTIAAAPIVD